MITVFEPTVPEISYTQCNSSEVFVTVTDSMYDAYEIRSVRDTIDLRTDTGLEAVLSFQTGDSRTIEVEGFFDGALSNCGQTSFETLTNDLVNDIFISDFEFDYVCDDEFNLTLEYQSNINTFHQVEFSEDGIVYSEIFQGVLDSTMRTFPSIAVGPGATQLCVRVNALSRCDNSLSLIHI